MPHETGDLPNQLRAEIRRRGISQKEAAKQIGCDGSHVSKIINGHFLKISTSKYEAIKRWLAGVDERSLGGDDERDSILWVWANFPETLERVVSSLSPLAVEGLTPSAADPPPRLMMPGDGALVVLEPFEGAHNVFSDNLCGPLLGIQIADCHGIPAALLTTSEGIVLCQDPDKGQDKWLASPETQHFVLPKEPSELDEVLFFEVAPWCRASILRTVIPTSRRVVAIT